MEEIELTYLIKELPKGYENFPCEEVIDIYVPSVARHPDLRIRKKKNHCEITKKQPIKNGDASHQLETTIPLTTEEFEEFNQIKGKRVLKNRYYYKEGGIDYEIAVFAGDLSGLVLVDVEFDSLDRKNAFLPPSWLLADVTQEEFAAGGMLCGKTYADIEENLSKFGYKKPAL